MYSLRLTGLLSEHPDNKKVGLTSSEMDEILRTHLIDPTGLRTDDFNAFYEARKRALLALIQRAMGKQLLPVSPTADSLEDEEDDEQTLQGVLEEVV